MTKVVSRFARAFVTIAMYGTVVISAAPVKRGEDPEFQAAWRE
jgi:hypothetical protein